MANLQLDETLIAYDIEGQRVPLVFIHEVAMDRRLWAHQRAYFRPRNLTIAVDVLGHGEITWKPCELSIERASLRVQQLLEHLQTGPVFLVGASVGAAIAMQAAMSVPTLVQGLVLVSPWGHPNENIRSLIDRLFRLADIGDMTAYSNLWLRYTFPTDSSQRQLLEIVRVRELVLAQNGRTVAYTWAASLAWAASLGFDRHALLPKITMPSLVIAGALDLFVPPYISRAVVEALPDVEFEVWDKIGHFPFLEDARRFNNRLEAFIMRHSRQGEKGEQEGIIR